MSSERADIPSSSEPLKLPKPDPDNKYHGADEYPTQHADPALESLRLSLA
jgi:hypothetical protein